MVNVLVEGNGLPLPMTFKTPMALCKSIRLNGNNLHLKLRKYLTIATTGQRAPLSYLFIGKQRNITNKSRSLKTSDIALVQIF